MEHGYQLIFGTMSGGNLLRADKGLNLTSRILEDLNRQYRDLPVQEGSPAPGDTSGSPGGSAKGPAFP